MAIIVTLESKRCVKEESHVRLTTLKERLLETMQEEKVESETVASTPIKSSQPVKETRNQASQETYLTNELIQSQTIHPMVGMGDLTPYDFLPAEIS